MTVDFKLYKGEFNSRVFVSTTPDKKKSQIKSVTENNNMFEKLESVWTITDKSEQNKVRCHTNNQLLNYVNN